MEEKEKSLLEEIHALAQENNRILRGIQRRNRLRSFFRFLVLLIFISFLYLAYSFFQPVLQEISEGYQGIRESVQDIQSQIDVLRGFFGVDITQEVQ